MNPNNSTQPTTEVVPPVSQQTQAPLAGPKTNLATPIVFLILGVVIGASGLWAYQKYSPFLNKQPVNQTASTSMPTPTSDPTANWKTYTNTKYYFSFKYPSEWIDVTDQRSKELDRECRLKTDRNEFINGTLLDKVDPSFIERPWSKQYSIAGGKAVLITYTDDLGPGSKGGSIDLVTFNQVLSTFKFTDSTSDVTNWKTYTDPNFGFTFKYPSDYLKYLKTDSSGVTLGTSQSADGKSITLPTSTDVSFFVSTETPVDIPPGTPTTNVVIGGQTAQEITNSSGLVAWFSKNNIKFVVGLSYKDPSVSKQSKILFDQILSTFKFTK